MRLRTGKVIASSLTNHKQQTTPRRLEVESKDKIKREENNENMESLDELKSRITASELDEKSEGEEVWPRKDRSKWLAALFCATAALYTTRIAMPLCIVAVSEQMNWDKEHSGLVLSSFFWGYTATQIPGGWLSDKYGGEVMLTLSATGFAISTVAVPVFLTFAPLHTFVKPMLLVIVCRICLGIAQGLYYPSVASLLAKRIPVNDRSFAYSMGVAGGPVGSLLMGSFGSLMLTSLGWHWVFYVFGSLGLFWVLLWKSWFIHPDFLPSPLSRSASPTQQLTNNSRTTGASSADVHIVPWGKILRHPAVWAMVIVHFCHNCMYFILLSWMPTYFHENFPQSKGWVYNVCPYAGNLAGKIIGGYIADHLIRSGYSVGFTRKLLEAVGTALPAVIIVFVSSTTEFWQALLCLTLCLSLNGMTTSGSLVNPQDLAPKFAGSVSGLQLATGAIPGILGVYVTGYILHVTGSWSAVFQLIAGTCIFGTVVFIIFGKGKKIV